MVLKVCILLIFAELFLGGFAGAQICMTESQVVVGKHVANKACAELGQNVHSDGGTEECDDCQHIAPRDFDEDYPLLRLTGDLKLDALRPAAVALRQVFLLTFERESHTVSDSWMAADGSHFFHPLGTIVLRM